LFDPEKPARLRGLSDAVFVPEFDFELTGFVPDVVFPTAMIERDDLMFVYYGAADTVSAVTAYRRRDLLAALQPFD
ncbi:MAG TPA: glycosidase, partial [Candidatus Didemnitutus sp.]|nr:glycosidase [Candidatus Didemnitutus sp.]